MNKRRQLLKASAGALLLAHPALRAQSMHGMHGTHAPMMRHGMQNSHDTHGMAGHDMGAMHHDSQALMALDKMPSGVNLQPLPRLKNTSQRPQHFQATITAAPSRLTVADRTPTEFWLYNDALPGPQIEVYEGDTVEILFKNRLDEASTIHWHGLPVPADQDGNPQDAVPAGADKVYRFTLPKGSAGTYWYHPHPHGRTAAQVAHGLAGTFIVRAKDDPLAHLAEQHWMISDLRLDTAAAIPENTMLDWMNGREGQFVLINGQLQPKINLNTHTRLRIWNNCSSRYLRLAIPDVQWLLLGTDGGLLEQAQGPFNELFLAPAERVEVLLLSTKSHTTTLSSKYYNREKMMVNETPTDLLLAQLHIEANDALQLPKTLRPFVNMAKPVATKHVEFSEAPMDHDMMSDMSMASMQNMFFINGKTFEMQRIDLNSKLGEVEEWHVFNNSHMDHPFHLHGTQFQVVQRSVNGKITPEPFKAWRDTVNLRPNETVVFHVKQTMPGIRMFHCHILEHEDLGMMANLLIS